jgi:hypothetical protein
MICVDRDSIALRWSLLVAAHGILMCASAHAQCAYEAIVLPIPAGFTSGTAEDMNDDGVVVGSRKAQGTLQSQAFRWSPTDGYQTLPAPPGGAQYWYASRIGKLGCVAGSADVTGISQLYLQLVAWSPDGVASLVPPAQPPLSYGVYGIVGDCRIVGTIEGGPSGAYPKPFIVEDGVSLPIPKEFDGHFGSFYCANRLGDVAGDRWRIDPRLGSIHEPIIWRPGLPVQFLPALPSDFVTTKVVALAPDLRAIVSARQIVDFHTPYRSFLFDGARYLPIGLNEGLQWTQAVSINDLGQVVGLSGVLPDNAANVPFLWINGQSYDLRTLVTLPPNVKLTNAVKVLDDGRILGTVKIGPTLIPSSAILTPLTSAEDITLDGKVDAKDLATLIDAWGEVDQSTVKRADIDRDGVVGPIDLAAVLGAWTVE